jgi:long-chain acyl-CoA synthetase
MTYDHFGYYVDSLGSFNNRLALANKAYIRTEKLRYIDLRAQIYRTAHYLSDQGISKGDRVMILANNSPQWIELLLGCQMIGAVAVPTDVNSSLKTMRGFIQQTEPKLIFKLDALAPELNKQFETRPIDKLDKSIAQYPVDPPKIELHGDDPALIVFTSGTTADPKGVVLSQKNILSNISGIQTRIQISRNWRLLSVLPLSHMYELTGTLAILSRGASIFYLPRVTPLAIASALQQYKITTLLAIPQLLSLLLNRINEGAAEAGKTETLATASKIAAVLPFKLRRLLFHSVHSRLGGHLQLVVTGGAPIPFDVGQTWERMGVGTVQGYGLTETSPILSVNALKNRRLDSPGRPVDNVKLRIANNGEIQASGPSVFSEYWHNEAATKQAFTEDGWFKTGDIGDLKYGWLHIKGRLKFAIVLSSGLKVFPEDIEIVADKNKVFKAFCVVGQNGHEGESVLAVVVSEQSDKQIDQAISDINGQLESFQHISNWERWPDKDFPRTRLLKVDRRAVADWANKPPKIDPEIKARTQPHDDTLVGVIRQSLGRPSAVVKDNAKLADLGLDSLRRLNLVALIESQIGITISEEYVTKDLTVSALRKLVNQGNAVAPPMHLPAWPYYRGVHVIGNTLREIIIHPIVRIWVKIDVVGRDNLRGLDTPAIFIFNHTDDFDGPVVYRSLPYYIRKNLSVAAADDVIKEHKVLEFIIRLCFAGFNFSRKEPYLPSLEYVGRMIDRGYNVALSPEGHISGNGKLQQFKPGIGLLAVNLGVPIVPIKTDGLRGTVPVHASWPKKHSRVTVQIGQPISFDADMDYDEVTNKLQQIMKNL